MEQSISVPVRLQVENLQSIINELQAKLSTLKVGSKGFKEVQSIITSMQRDMDKLQVATSKPFVSQGQFVSAERSVGKLEDELERVQITMSRIKFSDLELNPGQLAQLKEFDEQIKTIKNSIKNVKETAKQEFLASDSGLAWLGFSEKNAVAVNQTLAQITTSINAAFAQQAKAVEEAKAKLEEYKAAMSLSGKIEDFTAQITKTSSVKDTAKIFGDMYNQIFTVSGNAFKTGGKSVLATWLTEQFQLDETTVRSLVQESANKVLNSLKNGELQALINSKLTTLQNNTSKTNRGSLETDLANKEAKLAELRPILNDIKLANDGVGTSEDELKKKLAAVNEELEKYKSTQEAAAHNTQSLSNICQRGQSQLNGFRDQLASTNAQFLRLERAQRSFNSLKMTVTNFMGFTQVLNLTRRAIKEAVNHIKELDAVMNKIAIVTQMSTGDLWNQIDQYSEMAQRYGTTIQGAYEVSQIYYQQGLETNAVLTLTNETLKLAKVSGLDYAQTTDYMTTAMRGFKMEISEAAKVVDVYSNLAAHTAVTQEELAVAMSKTASSMESVGSTFEEASAMIGTMVAVTRESATNIGSALKSIAARYGEMKKDPLQLVDSEGEVMSYNKVDAALQSVGITLKTVDGQFRSFTDVILELSDKWDQLESTQQRYIATQFAGNRQQSRFLALVSNADLLRSNLDYAENSEDTGTLQALKALDSIESKLNQVQVAYQQFYTTMGVESIWKTLLDGTKNVINTLNSFPKLFGKIPVAAIAAISSVITLIKNLGIHIISDIANVISGSLSKGFSTTEAAATANNFWTSFKNTLTGKQNEAKQIGATLGASVTAGIDATKPRATVDNLNAADRETYTKNNNTINMLSQVASKDDIAANAAAVALLNQGNITLAQFGKLHNQGAEAAHRMAAQLKQENQDLLNHAAALRQATAETQVNTGKAKEWIIAHKGLGTGLQSFGSALNMVALMINTTAEGGKTLSGTLMTISGVATLAGVAIKAVAAAAQGLQFSMPWMAIVTGLFAVINGISTLIVTPEERIKELEERAEELNNKAKEAKANYRTLDNSVKKIEELREKRHESAEAAEEYQTAVDELAEKFPQLIAGFDDAGNIILDTTDAERVLAEARERSRDAAYEAAKKELELVAAQKEAARGKVQQALNKLDTANYTATGETKEEAGRRRFFYNTISPDSSIVYADRMNGEMGRVIATASEWQNEITPDEFAQGVKELNETLKSYGNDAFSFLDEFYGYTADALKEYMANYKTQAKAAGTELPPEFYEVERLLDDNGQEQASKLYETVNSEILTLKGMTPDDVNLDDQVQKTREAIEAYKQFVGEGSATYNLFDPVLESLNTVNGAIGDYIDMGQIYKGNSKAVVSAWQQSISADTTAWESLQNSSLAAAMVTEQIVNDIGDQDFNVVSADSTAIARWRKYQQNMAAFIDSLSEDELEKFNSMLEDTDNYTAEDIISNFDIKDDTIIKYITDYYANGIDSIQTRLRQQLAKVSGNTYDNESKTFSNDFTDNFYADFAKITNDNLTNVEEKYLNGILKQYDSLVESGYKNQSRTFGSSAIAIYKDIQEEDADTQKALWTLIEEHGITTLEGIQSIKAEIENNSGLKDTINLDLLDALYNNIVPNINLALQTATAELLDTWEDTSKELSSALNGGVSLKDADSLIAKAQSLHLDFNYDNFQLVGDKLVLTKESFDAYYKALTESNTTASEEWHKRLTQTGNTIKNISEQQKTLTKETMGSDAWEPIRSQLDAIGWKWETEGYWDENGKLSTEGIEALNKAYDDDIQYLKNFDDAARIAAEQLMTSYEQSQGIYKIDDKVAGFTALSEIASSTTLEADEYQKRQIKEQLNSVYDSLISDVLSKGFENVNFADYEGLIASDDMLEVAKSTGDYKGFVKRYAALAGKTLDETNELLLTAIEKQYEKIGSESLKDLKFIGNGKFTTTSSGLKEFVNRFDLDLSDLLTSRIVEYDENLEEYVVDYSRLDTSKFDSGAIEGFQEAVADSVTELFEDLAKLVEDGIKGSLSNIDKKSLIDRMAREYNVILSDEDFIATNSGLELTLEATGKLLVAMNGKVQSVAEMNNLVLAYYDKQFEQHTTDSLKNLQFVDDSHFAASSDNLLKLAEEFNLDLYHLFSEGFITYDEVLKQYVVDFLHIDSLVEDFGTIDNFQEFVGDSINDFFGDIKELIEKAFKGSLSNTEAADLQSYLSKYNIKDMTFEKTADGLKICTDSAIELNAVLSETAGLSDAITFEMMRENLEASNEQYKTVTGTMGRMADIQKEITDLQREETQYATAKQEYNAGSMGGRKPTIEAFEDLTGNVNMYNRPWIDNADGSHSSLLSTGYTAELGEMEAHVLLTPIPEWAETEDDVLDTEQLDKYFDALMEKNPIDVDALLKLDSEGVEIEGKRIKNMLIDVKDASKTSIEAMDAEAVSLHEWSDAWEKVRRNKEAPDNSERINALKKEYQIACDIKAIRSTSEDASFKFMENDIPGGQNNPLNYYENWAKAYQELQEGFAGKGIDYTSWYNIINEFTNVAKQTQTQFDLGGEIIDGSMERCAELIEKGAAALRDIDKNGKLEVDLGELGLDVKAGSKKASENVANAINAIAKDQIDALDAMIALLEVVVAMEELKNLDLDEDNEIDLGEIFKLKADKSIETDAEGIELFTDKYQQICKRILEMAEDNGDLSKALDQVKLNNITMRQIFEDGTDGYNNLQIDAVALKKAMNAFYQMALSDDYDLDNMAESLKKVMSAAGLEDITVDVGTKTFYFNGDLAFEVDWGSDAAKEAVTALKKNTKFTEEELHDAVADYSKNEYDAGDAMLTYVLAVRQKIKLDDKGNVIEVNVGGHKYTQEDWGDDPQAYLDAATLEDFGIKIPDDFAKDYDKDIGLKVKTKLGTKEIKVVGKDGKVFYEAPDGTQYSSEDELLKGEYQKWLDETNGKSREGLYNSQEEFNYGEYGIRGKVKYNVTLDGEEVDVTNDPGSREALHNKLEELKGETELALNKEGNLDIELDNNMHVTLDGDLVVDSSGNIDKAKVVSEIQKLLGLDAGLVENITQGLNDAFSGETIKQSIASSIAEGIKSAAGEGIPLDALTLKPTALDVDTEGLTAAAEGAEAMEVEVPSLKLKPTTVDVDTTGSTNSVAANEGGTSDIPIDSITLTPAEVKLNLENIQGESIGEQIYNSIQGYLDSHELTPKLGSIDGGNEGDTSTNTSIFTGINNAISNIANSTKNIDVLKAAMLAQSSKAISADAINRVKDAAEQIPDNKIKSISEAISNVKDAAIVAATEAITNVSSTSILAATKAITEVSAQGVLTATQALQTAVNAINTIDPGPAQTASATLSNLKVATLAGSLTLSYTLSGGAHAKGNVGKGRALAGGTTKTLMGELGPELVVSDGRYYMVGQNGAEFVDLASDAIVFNHLQTQRLVKKGSITGRGKPRVSERESVSFAKGTGPAKEGGTSGFFGNLISSIVSAVIPTITDVSLSPTTQTWSPIVTAGATGNMSGPAMASAKALLAALKQLRAQWQALAGLGAADLAGLGGSGGGGGGGKDKEKEMKAFIKQLEIWYNWLQRIAVLEQKINYEEAKRNEIASSFHPNGKDYVNSLKESLNYLQEQAAVHQSLAESQQEYFDKRREELNNNNGPFDQLYTFDEFGQLKYKDGKLEELSKMSGRNEKGKPNKTAAEQYDYIVNELGIDPSYMQYDSSGNKIDKTQEGWEAQAVQAFWDKIDADQAEMQNLHDSIEEHKTAVLEAQQKQNEIIKEIEDNQIAVENKVLSAIEESRQREIDELQKQRDALQEASQNVIDGLSEQLQKERDMYEQQQSGDELTKLQRQLAILQRSGGSAAQIASLQKEISQKQQDAYFDMQQAQIDALQEASDNEIEKLDKQIDLMTETLEYEKLHGMLWDEVYEVLAKSPEEIANFIRDNTESYWGQSPTQLAQTMRDDLFEAEKFKAAAASLGSIADIVKKYDEKATEEEAKKKRKEEEKEKKKKEEEDKKKEEEEKKKKKKKKKKDDSSSSSSSGGGDSTPAAPTVKDEYISNNAWTHAHYKVYSDGRREKVGDEPHNFIGNSRVCAQCETTIPKVTGNAFAKGKSLLGELGPEAWVSNGQFHISGQSGAEMVNLPDDAIVFNHQQTANLLRTGHTIGRGKTSNVDLAIGNNQRENFISSFWNSVSSNQTRMNASFATLGLTDISALNSAALANSGSGSAVIIENASVNMNVSKIANDYDAQRAGEQALEKMVQIARKTQGQNRIGR